jgi:hypothetical protein
LDFYLIYIIFKVTFFGRSIREYHASIAMLNSTDPFALIAAPICPIHFSVTFSFVIFVLTFVNVTTRPDKLTESTFSIIYIITFITIALWATTTPPFAFSMLHSPCEISYIYCPVCPRILTFTLWLSVDVFACVRVPIRE